MSEKITIKIIVFNDPIYLKTRRLETVWSFIAKQINKIPEEYRSIATWSMSNQSVDGDVNLVIAYKRLETDFENTIRDAADLEKANKEQAKLVEEATLLANKYPGILMINPDCVEEF